MNDILTVIADNQALQEALRALLIRQFDPPKLITSLDATTNEVLGQQTRARITGLAAIDSAFKEIQGYKTPSMQVASNNPGR